jgi:hypothetical protein
MPPEDKLTCGNLTLELAGRQRLSQASKLADESQAIRGHLE